MKSRILIGLILLCTAGLAQDTPNPGSTPAEAVVALLPGFRDVAVETLKVSPFTPLTRISGNSMDYLIPLIQPKITGVAVSDEMSSLVYDGNDVFVGETIKYAKQATTNAAAYLFSDIPMDKAPVLSGGGEGSLRVRSITSDSVVLTDESGYDIVVPVSVNSLEDEDGPKSMRVSLRTQFVLGSISDDGKTVVARLPLGFAGKTAMRATTRFAVSRTVILDKYVNGLAYLTVDGPMLKRAPSADKYPLPSMDGLYALVIRGAGEGMDLVGALLDLHGDVMVPRDSSIDSSILRSGTIWRDGALQGFADEAGRLVTGPGIAGKQKELCIVIFTPLSHE